MFTILLAVGAFLLMTQVLPGRTGGNSNNTGKDDSDEVDLLQRKRPPTKEEIERQRNEMLIEVEGLIVKADLQIKSQNTTVSQMSELQRKLDSLQQQQDRLPLDALIDTAKFMGGLVPFVSSGFDIVEAMKSGNEAIELRKEAERLETSGEKEKAEDAHRKADEKASDMLKALGKAVIESTPILSDVSTLIDVNTYNPRLKVVEIETLKVSTETQMLTLQKTASSETLERIEKELDKDDPRLEECRQRHQLLCEKIDEQVQQRSEQFKQWAEAVKKLGPYVEERPETEDMPKIEDFGSAHAGTQKIVTQARETLKENDNAYRGILKDEIEGIKQVLPPGDEKQEVDPESLKPPEQRSLIYYKKLYPTASTSELQGLKLQDVKKARSERQQRSLEQEKKLNEQRRSKREEKLRQLEERRMQVERDRQDDEQNRSIDRTTLDELIEGREQTLREMRENMQQGGGTTDEDIRDIERMFDNLEKEKSRRHRESRDDRDSDYSFSNDELKQMDQDAVQDWTKQEIDDFVSEKEQTLKEMRENENTTEEDIRQVEEMFNNVAEVANNK